MLPKREERKPTGPAPWEKKTLRGKNWYVGLFSRWKSRGDAVSRVQFNTDPTMKTLLHQSNFSLACSREYSASCFSKAAASRRVDGRVWTSRGKLGAFGRPMNAGTERMDGAQRYGTVRRGFPSHPRHTSLHQQPPVNKFSSSFNPGTLVRVQLIFDINRTEGTAALASLTVC